MDFIMACHIHVSQSIATPLHDPIPKQSPSTFNFLKINLFLDIY